MWRSSSVSDSSPLRLARHAARCCVASSARYWSSPRSTRSRDSPAWEASGATIAASSRAPSRAARPSLHAAATSGLPASQPANGSDAGRTTSAAAAIARHAATSSGTRQRRQPRGRSSSASIADIDGNRCAGSAARPRLTIARSHAGTLRPSSPSAIRPDRMLAASSPGLRPSNGATPSSARCSDTAKLNWSDAGVTISPAICSGAA